MTGRSAHMLRRNHRSTALAHLIAVDTEAVVHRPAEDEEVHTLRCGTAAYWSPARKRQKERLREVDFTDAIDFWRWAIEQLPSRSSAVVVAHNAAYDCRLLDMFRLLPYLGFRPTRLTVDDPPFITHWTERCHRCEETPDQSGVLGEVGRKPGCTTGKHRSLRVWSTTNIVQCDLDTLARSVGGAKLPMPSGTAPLAEWLAYCRRDTMVLLSWYRSYVAWLQRNDMGNLSPTIAGQAWHAFTHRYLDHPILIHDNPDVLRLERSGYLGGRTECFRLGLQRRERWTHLDVNALYPSVMQTLEVPTRLVTTRRRPSVAFLERFINTYCVVGRVLLSTASPLYPKRRRGSLCFPVGDFATTLTTPELRRALRAGHVRSCAYAAFYDRAPIFGRFVAAMWALRTAAQHRGDPVGDLVAKLLSNSLSAKFAQRRHVWLPIGTCDPDQSRVIDEWDVVEQRHRRVRELGGIAEEKMPLEESAESFPAIAAHVTAGGRLRMADLLALLEPHDCAYTDTDSLIVNDRGLQALAGEIHPTEIGRLRIVAQSDHLDILGAKWYVHGDAVVTKGARLDAEYLARDRVRQWHWHGLPWSIEQDQIDRVALSRVEKHFTFSYTKGTVDDDGLVWPLRLHEPHLAGDDHLDPPPASGRDGLAGRLAG